MNPFLLYYILHDDHTITSTDDVLEWARWFEIRDNRRVALTEARFGATVSTVFLGIDHNWGDGPPLIFETMVFGGPMDQNQVRYSTYEETLRGHALMVKVCNDCTVWDNFLYWMHCWYRTIRKVISRLTYPVSRKLNSAKEFVSQWHRKWFHT